MCFGLVKSNFKVFFLSFDPSNKYLMCRTLITGHIFIFQIRNMNDFSPFYSIYGLDGMRKDKRLVPNWTGM